MDDVAAVPLAHPGEVPEERFYAKLVPDGDRVRGQWRRQRNGEFHVWELPDGTVVRWQRVADDGVVEDHLNDAAGYPLVTVLLGDAPRATVSAVPPVDVDLAGWVEHPVPGGTMRLPSAPSARAAGGVEATALGGALEVWTEAADDVFADAFGQGLAAGCGCAVLDRATAWVGGRPGVRYRLAASPAEAIDVWAVPVHEGTWVMAFRAPGTDPVAALLPARALVAGVTLLPAEGR